MDAASLSATESSILRFNGLPSEGLVSLDDVVVLALEAAAGGTATLILASCGYVGLTTLRVSDAVGRRVASAELTIEPLKMRQQEFAVLVADLEATWAGLILSGKPSAIHLVSALKDATSVWRTVAASIVSITESPHAPLARGRSSAPFALARHVDFRPTAALAIGMATRQRLPTVPPVAIVDNEANRMVALLCERVAVAARRGGDLATSRHAERLRSHPTLAGIKAAEPGAPDQAMRTDPRYVRCLRALRDLDFAIGVTTEGPGPGRPTLRRIPELYEYWVWLQVLRQLEVIAGRPLPPGYDVLGRRSGANKVRLELAPGTAVAFPGGIVAMYAPSILSHRSGSGGLRVVPRTSRSGDTSIRAQPDVVVCGPGGLLVFDAKYVGQQRLDAQAQAIHRKYARIVDDSNPRRGVRSVIAVHPHAGQVDVDYAGYSAMPLVPQGDHGWLPARLATIMSD